MGISRDSLGSEKANSNTNRRMEETAVAEAPGQESGAEEANAGIMTVEDLAATFVERVETEDASEAAETEAVEETSTTDAVKDSEADVLSPFRKKALPARVCPPRSHPFPFSQTNR